MSCSRLDHPPWPPRRKTTSHGLRHVGPASAAHVTFLFSKTSTRVLPDYRHTPGQNPSLPVDAPRYGGTPASVCRLDRPWVFSLTSLRSTVPLTLRHHHRRSRSRGTLRTDSIKTVSDCPPVKGQPYRSQECLPSTTTPKGPLFQKRERPVSSRARYDSPTRDSLEPASCLPRG